MPSSTICASLPLAIRSRSMKSIQGLWPCSACSRCSVFEPPAVRLHLPQRRADRRPAASRRSWSAPVIVSRSPIYSRRPEPTSAFGRPAGPGPADHLARGVGDVARVDARRREQLGRRPRSRHRPDRELRDGRMGLLAGEDVEHRVADAALRPVVLDGDDRPRSSRAAARSVSASIGFTEYRSITRALMPSAASGSAAAIASCSVMPAPTSVTRRHRSARTTRLPPMWKASPGA